MDNFKEGGSIPGVNDTIIITSHAFAKTEKAFEAAREKLLSLGYAIPDHAQESAKEGQDFEFYSLQDISAAECGSCDSVISSRGVAAHNHKCECCGTPTCLDYVEDGAIRFRFIGKDEYIGNPITFKIIEFREPEEGDWNELVVHAAPILDRYENPAKNVYVSISPFDVNSEAEAQDILSRAGKEGLYKRSLIIDPASGEDIPVLILKSHKSRLLVQGSTFNTHEIYGRTTNYRMVKIYNGQKFSEWDKSFPLPQSLHLSRKYADGKKHSLSEDNIHEIIMQAAGQVSRADYYHQDGRAAFSKIVFERMSNFVEHFVDVPFKEWQKFLKDLGKKTTEKNVSSLISGRSSYDYGFIMSARSAFSGKDAHLQIDGPGFIYALAEWAGKMSDGKRKRVRDEPNIGNALEGAFKLMSGQTLSEAESAAMLEGSETPEAQRFVEHLQETLGEKAKAARRETKWRKNARTRNWDDDGEDGKENTPEPDSP